jgi:hypothetical protein
MEKYFICFAVIFAFIIPAAAATSATDVFSWIPYASAGWDAKTITESGASKNMIDQKVMFKGKKMRMESLLTDKNTGKQVNQVMIVTNKIMYILNMDEKTGTKFSMDNAANPEKYMAQTAKYRENAKKTGSETINGIACGIYKYTYVLDGQDNGEKMDVTEWRAKDGFVVKNITKWKDSITTSVVSNLEKDIVLSNAIFEPSLDIKIVDMDNMMKGIFAAPAEDKNAAQTVITPATQAGENRY